MSVQHRDGHSVLCKEKLQCQACACARNRGTGAQQLLPSAFSLHCPVLPLHCTALSAPITSKAKPAACSSDHGIIQGSPGTTSAAAAAALLPMSPPPWPPPSPSSAAAAAAASDSSAASWSEAWPATAAAHQYTPRLMTHTSSVRPACSSEVPTASSSPAVAVWGVPRGAVGYKCTA